MFSSFLRYSTVLSLLEEETEDKVPLSYLNYKINGLPSLCSNAIFQAHLFLKLVMVISLHGFAMFGFPNTAALYGVRYQEELINTGSKF